jgi:hypothetical protein
MNLTSQVFFIHLGKISKKKLYLCVKTAVESKPLSVCLKCNLRKFLKYK